MKSLWTLFPNDLSCYSLANPTRQTVALAWRAVRNGPVAAHFLSPIAIANAFRCGRRLPDVGLRRGHDDVAFAFVLRNDTMPRWHHDSANCRAAALSSHRDNQFAGDLVQRKTVVM
jgi:hypothetical protein